MKADVIVPIYNPTEHGLDLFGSRILFICFRTSNITAFSCGRVYFLYA